MKKKMWQSQLPPCVTVMLLLLCIDHPLVVCTDVTPTCSTREPTRTHIQVIAVVSTNGVYQSDNVQLPDWQKSEEILPGAQIATKEINNIPNLLSGHRFEVVPVRVPQCELVEGIVPFVEELTSNHNITIGIVGYFCPNLAQHLSPLAHYWMAPVVQISATSLGDNVNDINSTPHLQHSILPLRESTASAIVQLIQRLGWNKIAVISNQNPYFIARFKKCFPQECKRTRYSN